MSALTRRLLPLLLTLGLALPAAAASLTTFDGSPADITDFTGQGQWTIVKIWASDCAVCNQEAHAYVAFHDKHQADNARMLGISVDGLDNLADAQGFVSKHALNYPNLIIDWGGASRLFYQLTGTPLNGTPAFLAFDPNGELVAQQVGAVPVEILEVFIADNGKESKEPAGG